MPNQPRPGQRLLGASVSPELWRAVEEWERRQENGENKSDFVRRAAILKLQKDGIPFDLRAAVSKGKRRVQELSREGYPPAVPGLALMANEPVSSSNAAFDAVQAIGGNVGKVSAVHLATGQPAAPKSKRKAGAEPQSKSRPGGPGHAPKSSP